ncbi:MAG: hypothetical protein ACYDH6_18325 [Acidimicrobiales bacterium]
MSERGSILILVPALLLVLMALGVIAVDSAAEYLAHRELTDFTAGAADDVVAASLDHPAFYRGSLRLQPQAAQTAVDSLRGSSSTGAMEITEAVASVSPAGDVVTVRATATVRDVFGTRRAVVIHAASTARVREVRVS